MKVGHLFKRLGIALLCFLGYIGVGSSAKADTYYVAKTGSDSNSCMQARNQDTTKVTINAGLNCLSAGDTLIIRAGTYTEFLNDSIPAGISWNNPVMVKAASGETVIIKPSGQSFAILIKKQSAYIILDGLIVDGSKLAGEKGTLRVEPNVSHVKVQNMTFRNVPGDTCVSIGRETSDIIFSSNIIHGCHGQESSTGSHGIYWHANNSVIENNEIYDTTGFGIQIYDAKGFPILNVIVRSNFIYDTGMSDKRGGIVTGSSTSNLLVYNNIVVNSNKGITINGSSSKYYNNTIWGTQNGILLKSGKGNEIINNIANVIINNSSGNTLKNNLTSNPGFVDSGNADYHLRTDSIALDTGQTLVEVRVDFEGASRPQGAGYDIGAYEFRKGDGTSARLFPPERLRIVD